MPSASSQKIKTYYNLPLAQSYAILFFGMGCRCFFFFDYLFAVMLSVLIFHLKFWAIGSILTHLIDLFNAKCFVFMTGMISILFGLFWVALAYIGWWVATSGQGLIGLGFMLVILIIEGIVYNAVTKPKTDKPKAKKTKKRRRR